MKTRTVKASAMAACLALLVVLSGSPVSTHHSFAMYDQTKVVTLTGVMKQFVPQANHAELHFILLAPDHKALAKGSRRQARRVGRRDGGHRCDRAAGDHGDDVPRRHGVQRPSESAARRLELRLEGRRHRQVPDGLGHQQAEAARGRQALRLGAGPRADRRHGVLAGCRTYLSIPDNYQPQLPIPRAHDRLGALGVGSWAFDALWRHT